MSSFLSQLKQRRVYRVAIGYAVAAWLTVQIAATVLPAFHAPEFIRRQHRLGGKDRAQRFRKSFLSITAAEFRFDPRWDPLRKDPRFQALLAKYPAIDQETAK